MIDFRGCLFIENKSALPVEIVGYTLVYEELLIYVQIHQYILPKSCQALAAYNTIANNSSQTLLLVSFWSLSSLQL